MRYIKQLILETTANTDEELIQVLREIADDIEKGNTNIIGTYVNGQVSAQWTVKRHNAEFTPLEEIRR